MIGIGQVLNIALRDLRALEGFQADQACSAEDCRSYRRALMKPSVENPTVSESRSCGILAAITGR